MSEKGRKSRRWRVWWDDGGRKREGLPPPKAMECALMRCGREHTVSPQRARGAATHTHTHTHTHHSFHFTATLLFQMSEHTCACTHALAYMPIHSYYTHTRQSRFTRVELRKRKQSEDQHLWSESEQKARLKPS